MSIEGFCEGVGERSVQIIAVAIKSYLLTTYVVSEIRTYVFAKA